MSPQSSTLTILRRGRIRTLDASLPSAEALAIREGRVAMAGPEDAVMGLADAGTLPGRVHQPLRAGVDIPELQVVILAAGGKSAVRVIQRAGRALRKCVGKKKATIHDFFDTGSIYLIKHSRNRMATCKAEGFELVVPDAQKSAAL